jgi:hypothetical protein
LRQPSSEVLLRRKFTLEVPHWVVISDRVALSWTPMACLYNLDSHQTGPLSASACALMSLRMSAGRLDPGFRFVHPGYSGFANPLVFNMPIRHPARDKVASHDVQLHIGE